MAHVDHKMHEHLVYECHNKQQQHQQQQVRVDKLLSTSVLSKLRQVAYTRKTGKRKSCATERHGACLSRQVWKSM
eukprot:5145001-Amphidinium_carterae.2